MTSLTRPGILTSVIRDMWTGPMLRGMPKGTEFDYGVDETQIWARLLSQHRTSTVQIATSDLARLEARQMVALLDSFLEGLRREHYWPARMAAAMQADPSWVGG